MIDASPLFQSFFSAEFFLALVIAMALIPIFKRPAAKIGLIDHPGGRKQHKASVPLAGGPAIFAAVTISLFVWGVPTDLSGMMVAAGGLFLIGLFDDIYDISAKFRLVAQASLVVGALVWDNNWISQISLTSSYTFELGLLQYPVTLIVILGIMNAINMLDGLDGLSSGVVLIILGFIVGIASVAQQTSVTSVGACILGAVLGFWAFNYRFSWREKATIFMGDSGTTLLGFMLPFLAIKLSTAAPDHAPKSLLLWLFAIPIWDICAVIIKRLRDGKSPLEAGRDHIHHVLMRSGLSVRHSLHLIYLLTLGSISFGVSSQYFALTKIETLATFCVFMLIYLGKVGSLSKKSRAQVYDLDSLADREEPTFDGDPTVVDLIKRSNTSN